MADLNAMASDDEYISNKVGDAQLLIQSLVTAKGTQSIGEVNRLIEKITTLNNQIGSTAIDQIQIRERLKNELAQCRKETS